MTQKIEKELTSHELAHLLLKYPDVPVRILCSHRGSYETWTSTEALTVDSEFEASEKFGAYAYGQGLEICDSYVQFGDHFTDPDL